MFCYHTCDSSKLGYLSNFLNIFSKLANILTDAKIGLHEMNLKSPNKLILGHVNINSVQNKFDAVTYTICNNIDIFPISETTIDDTFLTVHFSITGFSNPYRHDRNRTDGGLPLFSRRVCLKSFRS